MSQNSPPGQPPSDSPPSRGGRAGLFLKIFCSLVLLMILGGVYLSLTGVQGTEFNPTTFELRHFSYRKIPFTRIQVAGIRHSAPEHYFAWSANAFGDRAVLDVAITRHLRRPAGWPSRWDLVEIQSVESLGTGSAQILVEMLTAVTPDYDPFWETWSRDNPRLAAVFWPAVQDLSAAGKYTELPRLCELAGSTSQPLEFLESINVTVFPVLRDHALALQSQGEDQLARAAAEAALRYGSDPRLVAIAGDASQ
ncbi:MAG: hypothetical protein D6753_11130 [Planctomycetota bacterium]|nr:MAG: hypothetical protein D6753_11130 [Planctomycetota bacterium]